MRAENEAEMKDITLEESGASPKSKKGDKRRDSPPKKEKTRRKSSFKMPSIGSLGSSMSSLMRKSSSPKNKKGSGELNSPHSPGAFSLAPRGASRVLARAPLPLLWRGPVTPVSGRSVRFARAEAAQVAQVAHPRGRHEKNSRVRARV